MIRKSELNFNKLQKAWKALKRIKTIVNNFLSTPPICFKLTNKFYELANRSWCYKTILEETKIVKLKQCCSDACACTKMWNQCGYFLAKLFSRTVYWFLNGLFLLFQFNDFLQKSFITSITRRRRQLAPKMSQYLRGKTIFHFGRFNRI